MIEKVASVMREGVISGFRSTDMEGGKYVREFEQKWANYHQVKHAISVNSATSGLITALKACGIGQGKEVITTPFSFSATWSAIRLAGATPVFSDVELATMCLDWERTLQYVCLAKGIMQVAWNGNAGRTHHLTAATSRHHLYLIEDAAQAPGILHGDQYLGTFGDLGVVSLNEPKNIATGEGGMIMTNDDELARRCKLIRNHGENIDREWTGYNFRLTEIQAALGIMQLEKLEYLNGIRRKNWLYLCKELEQYSDYLVPQLFTNPDTCAPYCAAFRWLKGNRGEVANKLRSEGIPCVTGVNFLPTDKCPNANKLQHKQYLGFYQIGWPNTEEDMDDIVKGFKLIIGGAK